MHLDFQVIKMEITVNSIHYNLIMTCPLNVTLPKKKKNNYIEQPKNQLVTMGLGQQNFPPTRASKRV